MDKNFKLYPPVDLITRPISQWFGPPAPSTARWYAELGMRGHNGIDWVCPIGLEIKASHAGKVKVYSSENGGRSIQIYDYDQNIMTLYLHLDKQLIEDGDTVKRGQTIALSGNTGKYTTGPHLHFGLYELSRSGSNIKNSDNGYWGAIDPCAVLALKLDDGQLFKNLLENKVFIMKNGYKWWIFDEDTFLKYQGIPVNRAKIKDVDLITFNHYPHGGIIGKK